MTVVFRKYQHYLHVIYSVTDSSKWRCVLLYPYFVATCVALLHYSSIKCSIHLTDEERKRYSLHQEVQRYQATTEFLAILSYTLPHFFCFMSQKQDT